MLGKQYSLGSTFAATGESLVKLANFEELKNESQDVASFLKGFSPDSKYVYLHVIAMGAGEYYGPNINGDYFPENDLINRHKTFETQAKVFKEHDNKSFSPSYGKVAFAWYNPKMHRVELILAIDKVLGKEFIDRQARGEQLEVSMGCFPAGTDITLEDFSVKPIEDVLPGDAVISHLGNVQKVVTKFTYPYTGDMVEITVAGQSKKLKATGNHPILVRRYKNNGYVEEWVEAHYISVNDCLVMPVKDTNRDDYIIKKVKTIYTYNVKDLPVYNLSVENDESYIADSVAVHNCKVAFDVCSICGNKAKKPSDYCEHIRLHKNHIFPDGKQACMINYNPTFFDISIVKHRADRIAYVLDKVASVDNSGLSAELANEFENLGNNIPEAQEPRVWDIPDDGEFFGKVASVKTDTKIANKTVEKTAMIKRISSESVRVMNNSINSFLPILEKFEQNIPVNTLDTLATKYDIKDILKSFLSLAIQLKPKEITRIIIVKKKLPLELFGDVERGVHRALATKQDAQKIKGTVLNSIVEKAYPFMQSRSSILPLVLNRISYILGDGLPGGTTKQAAMYVPNPVGAYLDVLPGMNFGYVRHVPEFQDLNSGLDAGNVTFVKTDPLATTPIPVSIPQQQEIQRPNLNILDRNSAENIGYVIGNDYALYRNPRAVMTAIQEPDLMSSLGVIASLFSPVNKALQVTDRLVKNAGAGKLDKDGVVTLPFSKEHYFSSYLPEDRYNTIHKELSEDTSVKDQVDEAFKESSIRNKVIDVAETILLPTYYFRKAGSPLNLLANFGLDSSALTVGLQAIM